MTVFRGPAGRARRGRSAATRSTPGTSPPSPRQYESFIRRWTAAAAPDQRRAGRGAEAVRARTEVMDTYRRFPVLDPQLPVRLLPAGWLRRAGPGGVRRRLRRPGRPAERHVRAVVARFADGPHARHPRAHHRRPARRCLRRRVPQSRPTRRLHRPGGVVPLALTRSGSPGSTQRFSPSTVPRSYQVREKWLSPDGTTGKTPQLSRTPPGRRVKSSPERCDVQYVSTG